MKRSEVFDAFERSDVSVADDLAFHTDEAAERLFHRWVAKGSPRRAVVGIYHDAHGYEVFYVEPYESPSVDSPSGDFLAGLTGEKP